MAANGFAKKSMKKTLIVTGDIARNAIKRYVDEAPEGYSVTIGPATRTLEQNALLWELLTHVSDEIEWYGNKLTPEEWKTVFTASLKKQKTIPGIDGGFVVMGESTRKMTKREFSDLIELIHAFAAQRGIQL